METTRQEIARATVNGVEFALWKHTLDRQAEYELMVGGVFLMASYNALSSQLMVREALSLLGRSGASLLIGGLGLGYSLQEACEGPYRPAQIDVVELYPLVIDWNRDHLAGLNGGYLEAEGVRCIQADVAAYIEETPLQYDAICLDIDNGPSLLVRPGNSRVYDVRFFSRVKAVLSPDGVFVIWSCTKEPGLLRDLCTVYPQCFERQVHEWHGGKEIPYYLYIARP